MGNTISYTTKPYEISLGKKGLIKGLQNDNKSRRFAGVPYALPPTGEHRWRRPRPIPSSHKYASPDGSPYDATSFKPVCHQALFNQVEGQATEYSEDCLFLNIWTPVPTSENEGKKFPVVMWLHGGWFQMGDPSQEAGMDPTELISTANLQAVFVAIGYRLNIFGFLSGSALLEESNGDAAGNFGLWDQRLAMDWVRQNIHYFGGDPSNVTLGGRSAGAYGVEAQVLHSFRKDAGEEELFRRVYMISNAIPAQPKTVAECEEQFDEVCQHFKIDSNLSGAGKVDELRKVPAMELVAAIKELKNHTFRPVTDDQFFHSGMVEYLTSGSFAAGFKKRGMKLLIGEVLNEETLYSEYNSPTAGNLEALKTQIGNYYAPAIVDRILPHYELPETKDLQPWKTLYGNIIADGQVRAPSRFLVKHLSSHGVPLKDIWRYQIAYRLSFIDEKVAPRSFGVAHAMDKPFWNYSITHGPKSEERELMDEWAGILVAFVNGDQEYDFGTRRVGEMKVATGNGKVEVLRDERWEALSRLGGIFAGGEA